MSQFVFSASQASSAVVPSSTGEGEVPLFLPSPSPSYARPVGWADTSVIGGGQAEFAAWLPTPSGSPLTPLPPTTPALEYMTPPPNAQPTRRSRARSTRPPTPSLRQRTATPAPSDAPGRPADVGGANFRWGGKRYFLTYSQIGDRSDADLATVLTTAKADRWACVRETHEDGGHHWHVIAFWDKGLRSRRSDILDVEGCHPHVRTLPSEGDVQRVWEYMHKEEGAVHTGTWSGPIQVDTSKRTRQGTWAYIMEAETREEYIARVTQLAPFEYQNNFDRIKSFMDQKYSVEKAEYIPKYTEFPGITGQMKDWVEQYLKGEEVHRPKALIVWGPSRVGKTEWARSLGTHCYWKEMFNLDLINEAADYVIFDDITPKYFPTYKAWIGGQRDFNVTDKYHRKRNVAGGFPCIILMNDDPRSHSEWDSAWIRRNAVIVNIEHELWKEHYAPIFGRNSQQSIDDD
ncbi:hypothetical protein AX17_004420 [Amanita inopinata Kibby_2008]|nr:hypothetical protein AX17_004420 [Amanita inopinata Kibby_2008]